MVETYSSTIVFDSKDIVKGNKIACLITEDFIADLYVGLDKGLIFFGDNKVFDLMELVGEKDCKEIIKTINEYINLEEETSTLTEVQFEL